MSGMFNIGEVKVRPGAYSNIQKVGEGSIVGAVDGITAILFKADFGPLNEVVEIDAAEGYEKVFGTGGTTDAIAQAIAGGAKTVVCCRIGNGGTAGKITLKDEDDNDAVSIEAKYVGAKAFSVSVREQLANDTKKECIIYDGTKEFEKVAFDKGDNEADGLVKALAASKNFKAVKLTDGAVAEITQDAFAAGTDPSATSDSYSEGLQLVEAFDWNTVCVDTEDKAVHLLVQSYLNRIYEAGKLGMAVLAEKKSVEFETRMKNAAAFNDAKVVYVVNAGVITGSGEIDGYQTAARIAGMVAACPSNSSLTHTVVNGVTDLSENLTGSQIISAEKSGCLVLTMNSSKQVWIDSAINTLITPADNQDEGWKKIRRTKTRYELVTRAIAQADKLVGSVDNDLNGRSSIGAQIQGVGNAMITEGKLNACNVSQSSQYPANGDSCWFDIEVVDKDSAERIYLTYKFRFSTQE